MLKVEVKNLFTLTHNLVHNLLAIILTSEARQE
jgi:hypothetical protein